MSIELDASRVATAFQSVGQETPSGAVAKKATAALLGGASVTVTSGELSDLETLVERLRNENEKTKFSLLLTSLNAIGQSLDDTQRKILSEGLALSEKLEELSRSAESLTSQEAQAKAEAAILQAKIDALQKQIEQAVKDGKDHNELVAEQKRVREELDAKNQTIADVQGKIQETKNEISSVKSKISVLVNSIGENAVKTIANELAKMSEPEQAESPHEAEKKEAKEEATNPFSAIRDSLGRIERDITEAIEENRVETV